MTKYLGEIKIKGVNRNRFTNKEKEVDLICLFEQVKNKIMYHIVDLTLGEVGEYEFGMLEHRAAYGWILQEIEQNDSDGLFVSSEEMKKVYDEYNNKYKKLNYSLTQHIENIYQNKNKLEK